MKSFGTFQVWLNQARDSIKQWNEGMKSNVTVSRVSEALESNMEIAQLYIWLSYNEWIAQLDWLNPYHMYQAI